MKTHLLATVTIFKILRQYQATSFKSLQDIEKEDESLIGHLKMDCLQKVRNMDKRDLETLLSRIAYLYIPDGDADTKTLCNNPTQAEL